MSDQNCPTCGQKKPKEKGKPDKETLGQQWVRLGCYIEADCYDIGANCHQCRKVRAESYDIGHAAALSTRPAEEEESEFRKLARAYLYDNWNFISCKSAWDQDDIKTKSWLELTAKYTQTIPRLRDLFNGTLDLAYDEVKSWPRLTACQIRENIEALKEKEVV